MWLIALRDLQWRRRRFAIAVVATGLVFGMSLLMAGTEHTLYEHGRRIVSAFPADGWVVAEDAAGPFTSTTPLPVETAGLVGSDPGVRDAAPLVILHSTTVRPASRDVNVMGSPPGSALAAPVDVGRSVARPGEAVADVALGVARGETVRVGGLDLRVVGLADDVTWWFGAPTLFVALEDAQRLAFAGRPLATAVLTSGVPRDLPSGLRALDDAAVVADLERPLASTTDTIAFLNFLLWLVAAGIIGSMVYLSALERSRDLAVFKAIGATTGALAAGLLLQAVLLALVAAAVATLVGLTLAPFMPFDTEVPPAAHVRLLAVVLTVALLASLAGLRRVVRVPPALAFGGAP